MWEKAFLFVFSHFSIPSQWERPTVSLPWGILQSWKEHCFSRQRLFLSLVGAYTKSRERGEGSFRHMDQNFLILPSDLQLERPNPRPWQRCQCCVEVYLLLMMAHFHWDSCACIIPKKIQNKKKGKKEKKNPLPLPKRATYFTFRWFINTYMLQNIEFFFC